jgi:hypothetical protein
MVCSSDGDKSSGEVVLEVFSFLLGKCTVSVEVSVFYEEERKIKNI